MIVSSKILPQDSIQPDGRMYVKEEHVTDLGKRILVEYLSDDDGLQEDRMAARVPQLEEQEVREAQKKVDALLLNQVLDKHDDYIFVVSIADAKTTFSLSNDAEVFALKEAFNG